MLFCKRCNIYVEDDRSHCPICGKCVCEENIKKPRKHEYYPDNHKWQRARLNFAALISIILAAANIIWLFIELIIWHKLDLTLFFLTGSAIFFIVFVLPLIHKQAFTTNSVISAIAICAFLFFLETYTRTIGWGLGIVMPLALAADSLAMWVIMISRGYYKRSTMFPCLFIAILSTGVFLLNWLTSYTPLLGMWPSVVSISVSWGLVVLLFGIRYRKIVKGMKKDFHM